jgi:hypothetical protein
MLNEILLLKVMRAILAEPLQFVMADFFATGSSRIFFRGEMSLNHLEPARAIPNCHTACCFAGWTIAIDDGVSPHEARESYNERLVGATPFMDAANRLGLEPDEAGALFYVTQWPMEFQLDWRAASTPQQRAEIGARRIDAFIEEQKKENA